MTDHHTESANAEFTIPYILSQIAAIQQETTYLNDAISKLAEMGDGDSGTPGAPGNLQGQAKAMAFETIVQCRETTNQQLLRFYEKMYDDLTTARQN